MEDNNPDESVSGVAVAKLFSTDSTTALCQQLTSIFSNLKSTPSDRARREEECLASLRDTLFLQAEEISSSESLQEKLLQLLDSTFDVSVAKGCSSVAVVFDVKWKDQHHKLSRLFVLLLQRALKCSSSAECQSILKCVGDILDENVRTTTDILSDHLENLLNDMRSSDIQHRTAVAEVLTKIVERTAFVLKREPTLLEVLTTSCAPLSILDGALEATETWHRTALMRLVVILIDQGCFEVTAAMEQSIATLLYHRLASPTSEPHIAGTLAALNDIVVHPSFISVPWDFETIARFLVDTDWRCFSAPTRAAAALAAGKVAHFCRNSVDLCEGLAVKVLEFLSEDEEEVVLNALGLLREALKSESGLLKPRACIEALRSCIQRLSYVPAIFEVLRLMRDRYGESEMEPIYSLMNDFMQMPRELLNFGKLNALLGFIGPHAYLNVSQLQALRINVSMQRPIPVLKRSLPLLTTLGRTDQLDDVLSLLYHDDREVRLCAIPTVLQLCELIIAIEKEEAVNRGFQSTKRLNNEVSKAVECVLDVAVVDRVPEVRLAALAYLCPPFFPYLCLADNLDALFMARNDTHQDTQGQALVLLCRLHPYHPAIVEPQLQRMQEYMLHDMSIIDSSVSSSISKIRLLHMCAKHDALLIQCSAVESVIVQRLETQPFYSGALTISLLELLEVILVHCGPQHHLDFAFFTHPLLTIINYGESSRPRWVALRVLTIVVTMFPQADTSLTVEVYRTVVRIIRREAEEVNFITTAALSVMGAIGAASSVKIRKVLRLLESDEIEEEEEVVTSALVQCKPRLRISPKMAERYPMVVLYYLVRALQLSLDPKQQMDTLTTIRTMLQDVPGSQKAILLGQLLPQLQSWLRDLERPYLYETVLRLMNDLAILMRQFKDVVPTSSGKELLQSVHQFCLLPQASQKPFNIYVVQLLDNVAKGLPAQEMRDNRWAVDFIHQRLSQNKNDLDLVHRVVKSLESFFGVMHEKDLQIILPHVLECIEPAQTAPAEKQTKLKDLNDACFDFLNCVMAKQLNLVRDCCAQIVHTIMWYIQLSDNREEMDVGLNTLVCFVDVVKPQARRFIMPIDRVAAQKGYPPLYFVKLVESSAGGAKARQPALSNPSLNPDRSITVVSHFPCLSQSDFESEMRNTLRVKASDFVVSSVRYVDGQTLINFCFCPGADMVACFNLFNRKAHDSKSTFRRSLGILRVEQTAESPLTMQCSMLDIIAAVPSGKSVTRENSWIVWIHNTTATLLKNSPYSVLRDTSAVADRNADLTRDLFPFAAAAVCSKLNVEDGQELMNTFSQALKTAPTDIKQILFSFAEFMEAERSNDRVNLVKVSKQSIFRVRRDTVDQKFGINYDEDSTHGVVVTKLTPNGLGSCAGVPIGAQLLSINNSPVYHVTDIREMIEGLTEIELLLHYVVEERQRPERKPLMNLDALATVAFQSQMHAKAIYFNEVLFLELYSSLGEAANRKDAAVRRALNVAEDLMEFYGHLNLTMAANGLVKTLTRKFTANIIAPEQFGFDEIASLEQLRWWSEALRLYESRLVSAKDGSLDFFSFVGALRCEQALGNTRKVSAMVEEYWASLSDASKAEVTPFKARAAFSLSSWDDFDTLASDTRWIGKFGVVERCAALFRMKRFEGLLEYTKSCREEMQTPFANSLHESYSRAYDELVVLQHLRHFEELVLYTTVCPEHQEVLKCQWHRRLLQMSTKPGDLVTLLSINSLVLTPAEDLQTYVYVIRSLSKVQWFSHVDDLLTRVLGSNVSMPHLCKQDPDLIHAYMKYLYMTKDKCETYEQLKQILEVVNVKPDDPQSKEWGVCWLLLGEWTMSLFPDCGDEAINELICATELSPQNFSAFHSLGILHYDLARDPSTVGEVQEEHHLSCILALFKSIQLCSNLSGNVFMQDVLRILSVWFAHSNVRKINEAVHNGVQVVSDHVWLNVIPQLIARIGIQARYARAILADLLVRVGSNYPQALVYPLTVAEKSPDAVRRHMADRVLEGIRKHLDNNQVVEEASLISNELVRIAILWSEKWHAAIQQAAFKPDSAPTIMSMLGSLYNDLDHASTPNERNFERMFGLPLRRALAALKEGALDKAWSFWKQVYAQLTKMLGERRLLMSDVSSILDKINDSIVAVPGTFEHGKLPITIKTFHSRVYVMPSKQKPRRFGLDASDGNKYRFLLKGHEDMRQDERVMQFIRLIDTIFSSDNAASLIGLNIPQYAVIPLTDNVGIIGWVENTETIYKMLETHRQENDVSIYEEVNLIMKCGELRNIEEYHRLPKQSRKALLSYAMENSPNNELRRIIWDHNDTCEQWLSYRQSYGQTMAAMSMVGYVLGLGDRHLNNLMLQENGTVVHIDFGDCFEVAMHRTLYAEAVPFRLTRLLICALGITGVDGVYRLTCELAMKNLRRHSENLLSILEAFIYDPLINWRLKTGIEANEKSDSKTPIQESISVAADLAGRHLQESDMEERRQPTMQLSKSMAKQTLPPPPPTDGQGLDTNEEETRNQRGDMALARVHAKLTGQDFGIPNSSFSLQRSSRRVDGDSSQHQQGSLWGSSSAINFADSPKDSFAAPLLTTYLSLRVLNGGVESLDVPHQVDRLIQEATSLDNLADAYLTGWAPFW